MLLLFFKYCLNGMKVLGLWQLSYPMAKDNGNGYRVLILFIAFRIA